MADPRSVLPGAELRALPVHDVVPSGHVAMLVTDARWDPHLRPGEFAILDPTDTEPQLGELYGLMIQCSRLPRGAFVAIVQPCRSNLAGPDGVVYTFAERGRRTADGAVIVADGPLRIDWWHRNCRGRAVGVMVPERVGRDR